MHNHVGLLKELAELASREMVIEQAVDSVGAGFEGLKIIMTPSTVAGWQGRRGGQGKTVLGGTV